MKRWLILTAAIGGAAALALIASAQQNAGAQNAQIQVTPVQGNVYLVTGAGGNIVVQAGAQGMVVVDTGLAQSSGKALEAIAKLSPKKIQYVINTHVHPDHTGGNDAFRQAGTTIAGANVTANLTDVKLGAQIFAQDNVLQRMSAPTGTQSPSPFGAWPTETFTSGRKQIYFNGEPIEIIHQPHAHTDGDSIVFFRHSDVVAAGDIFLTTTFPFIDLERGGGIQGEIDALNNIIEIAVPARQEEDGTYVIPGHGRICDRFDVVEYRDMVTIVRDRVQASIKKGMTLDQAKAAHLTLDYDARYGAKSGFGTADGFVEAVYKSLTQKK
jgi:glyoxylase-like metal-dependent hydrolase (beta-lactamase superfamily II)